MKPKIFVTRRIPDQGLDLLKAECDIELNMEDRVLTKAEIITGVKGKEALLCLLTDTIDAEVMDANPNVKVIANYAVGYNNIDVKEATKRGIPVTNTPGVLTDTTADMAFALLMAAARRIAEGDRFNRAGRFKGWGPMFLLGSDVYGKTLGIIGMGRIGSAVAKRAAKGFDMKILYYDAAGRKSEIEREFGAEFVEMNELLKRSDFVTVHVPLMPETTHLISENELKMMKKTAYLINTSRGPVVDEKALVVALRENVIAGAGLDVYENEPELMPGLAELENAVLAPHLGSATIDTRGKMAEIAAKNLLAVLHNERPPNIVNPEVLK